MPPVKALARHAPAVVAYVFVTVVFAWPLVINLASVAPHDVGDPLLSTWVLWWNAKTVPFTDAWWNGPMFVPAPGAMAFSDHRVGLGLIATPIILAGVTPLAAHNVVFLLTFVLSAAAAYALTYTLTGRRGVAFIGGLAFGFAPFRADHLPHLELLASFWLPVVLLALHRAVDTGRTAWHIALAVSLTLTGFTTGYYFFFIGVLIGAWLFWFLPRDLPVRRYVWLGSALLVPFVPLVPVLLRYRDIHTALGLARSIVDIEMFSADLRGFLTPPRMLWFWNAPESWQTPEGAVFPGVTCVALAGVALWRAYAGHRVSARQSRVRQALLVLALAFMGVALIPGVFGPSAFELGPLRVSLSQAYKPLSMATLFLLVYGLTSPALLDAWRRKSLLVFYALATLLMWMFALGPTARLAGERVLYKAPYAWLMWLPGFDGGFRAPSRFAMLAALTLSVVAAIAAARLGARLAPAARLLLVVLASGGILLDGWVRPFPVASAPAPLAIPADVPRDAVIVEWPMGVFEDAATMYRATQHEHPIVNGLSGYDPPHYSVLRGALEEGRLDVLDALPTETPLAIFVSREHADADVVAQVASLPDVSHLESTDTHHVAVRGSRPLPAFEAPDPQRMLPLTSLSAHPDAGTDEASDDDETRVSHALDDERRTAWSVSRQSGNEQLEAELEGEVQVAAVMMSLGAFPGAFPREVVVSASGDGETWLDVWRGEGAAPSLATAVGDPLHVRVMFEFAPVTARFIRVRQVGHSDEPWAVAEFRVLGPEARP